MNNIIQDPIREAYLEIERGKRQSQQRYETPEEVEIDYPVEYPQQPQVPPAPAPTSIATVTRLVIEIEINLNLNLRPKT